MDRSDTACSLFILIGFFGHKFKPVVSGIVGTYRSIYFHGFYPIIAAYQYFFVVPKVEETFQKLLGYNTVWLRLTEKLHIDLGCAS